MKNLFYSTAVLLIAGIMQSICAQSWNYDGNAPTTERSIGTTSNQPFPIITNNNERLRIAANGNVGIGTNNPQNLLDLNSSTASNVFQRFSNFTTGNGINQGFRIGIDNSGNALLNQQEQLSLIISTNSVERMRINANGKVGIGTSEPVYTLQVAGSFSAKQVYVEDQDLLKLISELQKEVKELKQQLAAK